MSKSFLFQAIQFSQSIQTIQFSISTQLVLSNPDRALSGATIPGQSGLGSNGNEGVLHIPQSSSITGTSPSDCLVSYLGHSLGASYPSTKVQSVYSIAPVVHVFVYTQLNVKAFLFQTIQFNIRGAYDKFSDFFHMGTFIDSTLMKL